MTDRNVSHRFELSVEVPGTIEQVWAAIATADGITAWMMPTELEERVGGVVVFHMGDDVSSRGVVTSWDPPRRVVYEEDWATLVGQDPATVTPLVSEFLVEAKSGGTCVVRVVTSAFGSGADWEHEFFAEMATHWAPTFHILRLYLTHFRGQRATSLEAVADMPGAPAPAAARIRVSLGVERAGETVEIRGVAATVEVIEGDVIVFRLTTPVAGLFLLSAFRKNDETCSARLGGYLFFEGAEEYAVREQPGWQAWIEEIAAGVSV